MLGVNVTVVLPLLVNVLALPEFIVFTWPVAPVATAVTLPYASTEIVSIFVLFYVDPYVPDPTPPVAIFKVTVPEVPPPVKLVPAVTPVISPTFVVYPLSLVN